MPRSDLCVSSDGIQVTGRIGVVALGDRSRESGSQRIAGGDTCVDCIASRCRAVAELEGVLCGSKELSCLREVGRRVCWRRRTRLGARTWHFRLPTPVQIVASPVEGFPRGDRPPRS